VAKADLYPQFALSGSLSLDAAEAAKVFNADSRAYSFGPSFRWNLFRNGQIRNNIRAADARANQALARYEQTMLLALEEVENALVGLTQEQARRDALKTSAEATRRSVELAALLYQGGQTDFQNLLDSQRSLLSVENRLAASEAAVVTNLITLFKALGGGWEPEIPTEKP
jgi:outer membrane protein TolC